MRFCTRLGVPVSIPERNIIAQDMVLTKNETYYVLHLRNGNKVQVTNPAENVTVFTLDQRSPPSPPPLKSNLPIYEERKLPDPSKCVSAGKSMVAGKNVDYDAHEKVKGEQFFTHKTAPGLNIISPAGKIIHETKMSDMYKRRD